MERLQEIEQAWNELHASKEEVKINTERVLAIKSYYRKRSIIWKNSLELANKLKFAYQNAIKWYESNKQIAGKLMYTKEKHNHLSASDTKELDKALYFISLAEIDVDKEQVILLSPNVAFNRTTQKFVNTHITLNDSGIPHTKQGTALTYKDLPVVIQWLTNIIAEESRADGTKVFIPVMEVIDTFDVEEEKQIDTLNIKELPRVATYKPITIKTPIIESPEEKYEKMIQRCIKGSFEIKCLDDTTRNAINRIKQEEMFYLPPQFFELGKCTFGGMTLLRPVHQMQQEVYLASTSIHNNNKKGK